MNNLRSFESSSLPDMSYPQVKNLGELYGEEIPTCILSSVKARSVSFVDDLTDEVPLVTYVEG